MEEKNINGEREELNRLLDAFDKVICESQRTYLDHGDDEDIPKDIENARKRIINHVEDLLSQSKKESYNEGYMECSEDNRFIEHYELCKKNGMDTVTMAKNARRIKDKIDTILGDIVDKAELESLTNQKKDI